MQNANSSSGPCNIVLFLWKGHQSTFSYGSRQLKYELVFLKSRHSIIIHATSLLILWKIDSFSNHCVLDLKASSIKLDMALQPKNSFENAKLLINYICILRFLCRWSNICQNIQRICIIKQSCVAKITSSFKMNKTKTFRFKRQFPSRIIKI